MLVSSHHCWKCGYSWEDNESSLVPCPRCGDDSVGEYVRNHWDNVCRIVSVEFNKKSIICGMKRG